METNAIIQGDCLDILKTLPDKSVDCCVTSPPYYMLRDYGIAGQIGLEETPDEYISKLTAVFNEVYRVLKNEGSLWLNIGDSYNGSGKNSGNTRPLSSKQHANTASHATKPLFVAGMKPKQLIGVPWRLAFAMQADGWILRQDIIWAKPSCMPESVKDRFCKSHEYLFFFVKQPRYYFNHRHALEKAAGYDGRKDTKYKGGEKDTACGAHERWPRRSYAAKSGETGLLPQFHGSSIATAALRTMRDVWRINAEPSEIGHYAMFPQKLITPCILCGCPENGTVLDPFMGSGTTAVVAKKLGRRYIGCEINPEYVRMAERRIAEINPLFGGAL
jgi:DNA modification methylase